MTNSIIKNTDFKQWLGDLKLRIRQSQIKAAIKVNEELLRLYWDLGHDIAVRQMDSAWGSGFFEQLSRELRAEFPETTGFSASNLKYAKRFYLFYTQDVEIRYQLGSELKGENLHQVGEELQVANNEDYIIRQQVADEFVTHPIFQIPWFHHVLIFTKCQSTKEALFYVQKTIQNGWSYEQLIHFWIASYLAMTVFMLFGVADKCCDVRHCEERSNPEKTNNTKYTQ